MKFKLFYPKGKSPVITEFEGSTKEFRELCKFSFLYPRDKRRRKGVPKESFWDYI